MVVYHKQYHNWYHKTDRTPNCLSAERRVSPSRLYISSRRSGPWASGTAKILISLPSARKSNYHYHRRIPKQLVVDGVRFVRRSLKTSNIESARAQRNLLEAADDLQWAAQLEGHDLNKAHREYLQAVKRAEVLGLRYRAAWELLAARDVPDIVARIEAVRRWPSRRKLSPRRGWPKNRRSRSRKRSTSTARKSSRTSWSE